MNVIGLLKNAKSGNKEALALLHLGDDLKYEPPGQVTITNKEVVKEDLCTFTYTATAAVRNIVNEIDPKGNDIVFLG